MADIEGTLKEEIDKVLVQHSIKDYVPGKKHSNEIPKKPTPLLTIYSYYVRY